ncbi:MAG: Fic family protein [Patescibacteria group bacterium]|nr:Fic family protein [Patescibacteria group bacterium]
MVHSIIKFELALNEIKSTPLSLKVKRQLHQRMGAENLFNIAKLVGAPCSFSRAEKIYTGKTMISPKSPGMILSNYRSTCDFLYSSSNDKYISLSPSLLLHINKLLLHQLVETWEAGRFRNQNDEIATKYDKWHKELNTNSPDFDYQKHFYDVMNWFSTKQYRIQPIIKIGVVLYELFNAYPFNAGNQLTILATAELLFEKSRISNRGLFPVSRLFLIYKDEYIDALNSSNKKKNDITAWLEIFLKSTALEMVSLKNEIIRIEEEKIKQKKKKLLDLNSRQLKLLRRLRYKPKIYRRDYVDMMGISTMTAYRDLKQMVKRKIISVNGGGRSTYYTLPRKQAKKVTVEHREPAKVIKVINDLA